ncbi:hypothetical protein BSK49_19350 [Paenibacillus odorifer]|uniref:hypothetical protein n=1 Tax=Paenibacillus odorifer TaxID=189426 RepID=UPI00096EEDF3|nr:hypothetical protein [Paenibacillus odorifer]OMD85674.1 hypothetical protein BSK49_19350 [Paenibacillus odorifer]
MTQRELKRGDPVIMPSGLVTELTDIQYEHNRYQLEGLSGWQYGIENLRPAEWKLEAQKWRREALRKYPTPEAYEAACAALDKHRSRADAAEYREQCLKEAWEQLRGIVSTNATGGKGEDINDYDIMLNMMDDLLYLVSLYPDTPAPKEGIDWLNEESCARCGRNKPVEGYEWCSECRPDLEAKEGK